MLDRLGSRDREKSIPYILVHQTGLADTTVAEDDDLSSLSALPFLPHVFLSIRTFSRIFLRDAIVGVLCGG